MQAALKLKTTVLPGHRVEFTSRELIEGEEVELIVMRPENTSQPASGAAATQGVWDFVRSLQPIQRTAEEWAEIERELQEERNSWDC